MDLCRRAYCAEFGVAFFSFFTELTTISMLETLPFVFGTRFLAGGLSALLMASGKSGGFTSLVRGSRGILGRWCNVWTANTPDNGESCSKRIFGGVGLQPEWGVTGFYGGEVLIMLCRCIWDVAGGDGIMYAVVEYMCIVLTYFEL